jgi:iron complex outermembrane recepter protein
MKYKKFGAYVPRMSVLSIALGAALASGAWAQQVPQLDTVTIVGDKAPLFGISLSGDVLNTRRFATGDTASLLEGIPGMSLYTGGGVSSLPVINGLGDDRLKITVDGMSITAACPNHMNPALSYIDPAALSQLNVYAGIVPVSQGGDSIGGAIVVKSAPPVFAQLGEGLKTSGNLTAYHRSNGNVDGLSVRTNAATENFSIGYVGNTVKSGDYKDGNGNAILASSYKVRNNQVNLATKSGADVFTLSVGWQDIPYQGYPNQAMDMTSNRSLSVNAGYNGVFDWGTLEARAFRQRVRHKMDVFDEKALAVGYANTQSSYMPMDTDAVDLGYSIIGTTQLNEEQILRFGHEFHRYTLDDWWPPLSASLDPMGMMSPNTFWNINGGKRDRVALFTELDTKVNDKLSTQFGARVEQVTMNTGNVQGYYDGDLMGGMGGPYCANGSCYDQNANAFNAKSHKRSDLNLDLTAAARYVENANETYDVGFSRKTRSPNLHERYTWSHEAGMAGLMNNWFGDLNSYVGNIDLKPEVAYSLKTSADWHDADRRDWQVKVAPFYTYVKDYINATPDTAAVFNSGIAGRQALTFVNQDAYLYGFDVSGKKALGKFNGEWTGRASLSYTRGKTTSGDNLYNIMPLNARVALDHISGSWSNTLEAVLVSAKDNVSAVRAEQTTTGYSIANFRTSYKLNQTTRLDAGVDNLFNRQYSLPLGGLQYVSPHTPLAAMGRSVNVGVAVSF